MLKQSKTSITAHSVSDKEQARPKQYTTATHLCAHPATDYSDIALPLLQIESAILEAEPGHSKTRQASETQKVRCDVGLCLA